MRVYITRAYQEGEEFAEQQIFANLEPAQRWLESLFGGKRLVWKEPHPGHHWARIGPTKQGDAVYVTETDVIS